MKPLLALVFLLLWTPVQPGLLTSSDLHKPCHGNGLCRLECYKSEMLVAACKLQLECCIKGNPKP
ncbi:beta-defensin 134 [Talpa occidentalis]|uniref:beta-defensin 134 n=1 Tax=Talpa occidentalis TaxID=50954 RepID=UPI00189080DA|nr:beta-defensin 134 [Talpa occidentalis]